MRYLEVAGRLLLVTVFAVAVFGKVSGRTAWAAFVQSLRQLGPVRPALVRLAAATTVTTEAAVVLLLLVPVRAVGAAGFALAAGVLAVFTIVIGLSISRGNRAPCRCFGASSTPLGRPHLARNLVLIVVALLGLAATSAAGPADIAYALLAGTGGLVLGLLITAAEDIVALVRPIGGNATGPARPPHPIRTIPSPAAAEPPPAAAGSPASDAD